MTIVPHMKSLLVPRPN